MRYIIKWFYIIYYGIKNLIDWFPIIWADRSWDWTYFAKIMEYKLRKMYKLEIDHGIHTTSNRDAKDMLICAEILRRLIDDDDCGKELKTHWKNMVNLNKLFGKIIGAKMRTWWN